MSNQKIAEKEFGGFVADKHLLHLGIEVVIVPRSVWSASVNETFTASAAPVGATWNVGVSLGEAVPGTKSASFVEKIFVIDNTALVAVSASGSIYLVWSYGRHYQERGIERIITSDSMLSPLFGEDIPLSEKGVSAEIFFKHRTITVTRFGMTPSSATRIQISRKTVLVLPETNTGVSNGLTVPGSDCEDSVVRVFSLDAARVIAITSSGGCYFIRSL